MAGIMDWYEAFTEWFEGLLWWQVLLVAIAAAYVLNLLFTRVLRRLTKRTKTTVDDEIVPAIGRALFWSLLFVGIGYTLTRLGTWEVVSSDDLGEQKEFTRWLSDGALATWYSVLISLGVVVWAKAFMRASEALLDAMARRADDFQWIQPRSLPLYEILAKLLVIGGAIYGLMIAWDIDVTAWLASAGILGIAIGFAAKDTLANLFAGVFILTDAPYKLGDYVVMESGERGMVTDIGIRSTRLLTRDDIEITIPNSVMANTKIVNESSGRYVKRRIRLAVGVAYGSDMEQVRAALLAAAQASDLLVASPEPRVRFREFGDSALIFQVMGWISQPAERGRAVDQLGAEAYKRLAEASIEIPFPQRVVHMAKT